MQTPHGAAPLPDRVSVLVVGAGPSGLMLAAELALAGTRPLLVDALEHPTGQSRALGFTVRTLEIFAQRGLLGRFGDLVQQPNVHFAGLTIDGNYLSSPFRPANQYPQSRTESVLASWVSDLGVDVARPWRLASLTPSEDGNRCVLEGPAGPHTVQARYVVGCDGASSRVRELMGVDSDRTEASVQMLVGDLRGSGLPNRPFGVKHGGGMVMSAPLGDGSERVIVCDFSRPFAPQGATVSLEEVKAAYENVVGSPLQADECLWASSFTDASSLVRAYRQDGLFLVGDSAHTHLPAGGQGMNVSIQDAVNLGWKLAAVVQGRASDALLDTYHSERYPVAQQLLRNTAAQGQLFLRGPAVDPLREVLASLLLVPEVATLLADGVSGLDVRYGMGPAEDSGLLGARLPPGFLVNAEDGNDALEELQGGAVLLTAGDDNLLASLAARWEPHLRTVRVAPAAGATAPSPPSLLVRPDGHIAWVGDKHAIGLHEALSAWVGAPTTQLQEV